MKNGLKMLIISIVIAFSMLPYPITQSSSLPIYNLAATGECGYVKLMWNSIPNAQSYWIYRGPGEGLEYSTPLTDFPISTTEFKDDINIQNGQKYCYFVVGVNDKVEKIDKTTEACATPKCEGEENPPEEVKDCSLVLKFTVGNSMYEKNGEAKGPMTAQPEMKNNRMFLVIKYVADEVGATTIWDGSTKTVIIKTIDNTEIKLQIGSPYASVNGVIMLIDPNNPQVVPYISNGRTLCPLRFAGENLGATGPDKIKWYQPTQTAELIFTNPDCECQWIRCFIKEIRPPRGIGSVDPKFKFMLNTEGCDFLPHVYWVEKDMMDISGQYYISKYPHCVSLCVLPTGQVIKWKTEIGNQSNCCTGVMDVDAESYDQPKMHLFATKKMCQGVNTYIIAEDAFGNNFTVETNTEFCNECEEGKWFVVKGYFVKGKRNVIKADSVKIIADFDFTPVIFKTVCLEILSVSDFEESYFFYARDTKGVVWWIGGDLEGAVANIKEVKKGECWKFAFRSVFVAVPNSNGVEICEVFNGVISIEKTDCPCPSEITSNPNLRHKLKITNIFCNERKPYALGIDDNKTEWKLFMGREMCGKIKINEWYMFDGDIVSDKSNKPTLRVLRHDNKIDVELKEKPQFCFCFKISSCYWMGSYAYAYGNAPGISWGYIFAYDAKSIELIKDFKIGDCINVCGNGYVYISGGQIGIYLTEVISASKTDCNCKVYAIENQKVTVVSLNCRTPVPMIEVKNKSGEKLYLLLPPHAKCTDFAVGTCWNVFGRLSNDKKFSVIAMEEVVCNPDNCCNEFSFSYGMPPPSCPGETIKVTWKVKSLCKDGQNLFQLTSTDGIIFTPYSFVLSAGVEKSFELSIKMPPNIDNKTYVDLWFKVMINCKNAGEQNRAIRVYYKAGCP